MYFNLIVEFLTFRDLGAKLNCPPVTVIRGNRAIFFCDLGKILGFGGEGLFSCFGVFGSVRVGRALTPAEE